MNAFRFLTSFIFSVLSFSGAVYLFLKQYFIISYKWNNNYNLNYYGLSLYLLIFSLLLFSAFCLIVMLSSALESDQLSYGLQLDSRKSIILCYWYLFFPCVIFYLTAFGLADKVSKELVVINKGKIHAQ